MRPRVRALLLYVQSNNVLRLGQFCSIYPVFFVYLLKYSEVLGKFSWNLKEGFTLWREQSNTFWGDTSKIGVLWRLLLTSRAKTTEHIQTMFVSYLCSCFRMWRFWWVSSHLGGHERLKHVNFVGFLGEVCQNGISLKLAFGCNCIACRKVIFQKLASLPFFVYFITHDWCCQHFDHWVEWCIKHHTKY